MKKVLIALFFFIALQISVCAKELKFIQFSDTHLSSEGKDYRGRKVGAAAEYLREAVKQINKRNDIDFVVFTGDNIDTANRTDLKLFLQLVNKLNKPYYVVIGNHEVFRHQHFGKKEFMRTVWFYHPPMLFKGPSYVFKANKDIVFIVVDGANEMMPSPSGHFKKETLDWLDKKLEKYKNKKVIIAQHFPLIPPTKKYSHDTVDVDKYFTVLNGHDNVIAIISGHFHTDKFIYKKGIYHLSAPAFVSPPHEYKIITVTYEPKYLFAKPSEFEIKQELVPMGQANEEDSFVIEQTGN
ncbi:MAG: metallophosphoesterase [Candidatus Gastranaerophilales bacterium]|nr:metallophosphoesterase [Candidatus Gastranaerophilales bacterium]